jgi:hypothetical protein
MAERRRRHLLLVHDAAHATDGKDAMKAEVTLAAIVAEPARVTDVPLAGR